MAKRFKEPETLAPNMFVPGTKYRIIRALGEGGIGKVYEVENDELRTRHALKIIGRQIAHRGDVAWRLLEEARELGRFDNDHIVKVIDADTTADGRVFYVMELLHGRSLRDELRRQRASGEAPRADLMAWALGVILQMLTAIDAAHARGLMHRDIKPDNIFLTSAGVVKLLDFGVAKCINADAPPRAYETEPGDFVGTLLYAPPESLGEGRFDSRSDLYSLGVVLWEILAGQHPFGGMHRLQVVTNITLRGVPSLEAAGLGLEFPSRLFDLVRRATALDPRERFADAKAFAEAVLAVLALDAVDAVSITLPAPREPSLSAFLRATGGPTKVEFVGRSLPPAAPTGAAAGPSVARPAEATDPNQATGNPTAHSTPGAGRPAVARLRAWVRARTASWTPLVALGAGLSSLAVGVVGTFLVMRATHDVGPGAPGAEAAGLSTRAPTVAATTPPGRAAAPPPTPPAPPPAAPPPAVLPPTPPALPVAAPPPAAPPPAALPPTPPAPPPARPLDAAPTAPLGGAEASASPSGAGPQGGAPTAARPPGPAPAAAAPAKASKPSKPAEKRAAPTPSSPLRRRRFPNLEL